MSVFLHSLETLVPDPSHSQDDLSRQLQERFTDPRIRRLVGQAFKLSGIERRHMVVEGFFDCPPYDSDGQATTADRNAVYGVESRKLATALGEKILSQPGAPARESITHLVFATCTGFVNPGPDYHLVRDLGLRESVQRYTLGFMGCYAAIPGLKFATQVCQADPGAVVLVVALELCSLHMQIDDSPDTILGNTVFADGAAAAIVCSSPNPDKPTYRIDGFHGGTLPEGESSMAWSIGNRGFDLVLSSYVPKVIGAEIASMLDRIGVQREGIDRYAVHPGGKSILDRVITALGLSEDALDASRDVLRQFGNMSSATILFVLKEMLGRARSGERVLGLAFGPGLTIETVVLTLVAAT
ncbi:MAG: type III polyketide synthase [Verrucomicrobiales bacterium]|nr:type III polyketide synthase [Verrucomicrobiales bacterium]